MKRSTTIAATVLGLSLALASEAIAVPVTTSFTARIEDGNGPVNGLVNLNFKIYDAATAGTMVWEEMHTGVSANTGLVYVALGSIAPTTNGLDQTVFTGGARFLEVTVNGDIQSPRVPILSVPYAVRAATADALGSLAPADVSLRTHNHSGVYATASHTHPLTCTTVQASGAAGALVYANCAAGYVVTGGGCYYSGGPATSYEGYISNNNYRCRVYGVSAVNSYARCCQL
jgi:hypothetical protein